MIVYVDTNIIIDLLAKREPFYSDAYELFLEIAEDDSRLTAYTSLKSISDVYYIMHKYYHDKTKTSVIRICFARQDDTIREGVKRMLNYK